jgi:hypothetical protein
LQNINTLGKIEQRIKMMRDFSQNLIKRMQKGYWMLKAKSSMTTKLRLDLALWWYLHMQFRGDDHEFQIMPGLCTIL